MIRTKFMRISNKITCVFFIGLLFFAFAGCDHSTSSSSRSNSEEDSKIYIGTKKPSQAKSVGDIVFNDGSAMPYAEFTALTDEAKNTKKAAAIALIFYKGTGLNSDTLDENYNITASDNSTVRTLGVGLKHNKSGCAWCLDSADAYQKKITTIQCPVFGRIAHYTFKGDKDGSDNLEQIEAFDGVSDTTGNGAADRYPAFYFAKNYKEQKIGSETESRISAGSEYASGWYLPSHAELFFIYANGIGEDKLFDINAASEALGGDNFDAPSTSYRSSSQDTSFNKVATNFFFYDGTISNQIHKAANFSYVCAIREF